MTEIVIMAGRAPATSLHPNRVWIRPVEGGGYGQP
jgi:hypothetical protein